MCTWGSFVVARGRTQTFLSSTFCESSILYTMLKFFANLPLLVDKKGQKVTNQHNSGRKLQKKTVSKGLLLVFTTLF
jgi:hypothetical protein